MELRKKGETIMVFDNQNFFLFHMDTDVATVFCYHRSRPFTQWVRALRGAEHTLFSAWLRYNFLGDSVCK